MDEKLIPYSLQGIKYTKMTKLKYIAGFVMFSVFLCVGKFPSQNETTAMTHSAIEASNLTSKKSLQALISSFEGQWEFEEMDHGDIGYTETMYSIAAWRDSALQPLTEFIGKTKCLKAKVGALYSLYLIGVKSYVDSIAPHNKFTDVNSRSAILKLLVSEDSLNYWIADVLKRNPIYNDIGWLMTALETEKGEKWPIVNLLTIYELPGFPIHQKIAKEIADIEILIPKLPFEEIEKQTHLALLEIANLKQKPIEVDDVLLHQKQNKYVIRSFKVQRADLNKEKFKLKVGDFVENMCTVDRFNCGNNLQYFVKDGRLYFCSISTAKNRILKWWQELPDNEKMKLNSDFGVIDAWKNDR